MVKLTPELIEQSCQRTNPLRDRELSLRGLHIGILENLGAARNQFDTIDLTDNELRKLDGFPLMTRLHTVLATNNRITRIADDIATNLPNLSVLILTQNNIAELGELDGLKACTKLKFLTVLRNPITSKKHYRLFIIFSLPQLRVLDFKRVRDAERKQAAEMFEGRKGEQLLRELGKRQTVAQTATATGGGSGNSAKQQAPSGASMLTPEQVTQIREAIVRARTLEEVDRLNQILRSGQLPAEFSLTPQRASSTLPPYQQSQAQAQEQATDMETDDD